MSPKNGEHFHPQNPYASFEKRGGQGLQSLVSE